MTFFLGWIKNERVPHKRGRGSIIQWNWALVSPENCRRAEMLHYMRRRPLVSLGTSPLPNHHHGTLRMPNAFFGGGMKGCKCFDIISLFFPYLVWSCLVSTYRSSRFWFRRVKLQWVKVLLGDKIDLYHRKGSCSERSTISWNQPIWLKRGCNRRKISPYKWSTSWD